MSSNNKRKRIPNLTKVRAELQKEINSVCPFCANGDAGHFEVHHIDNNPSNNDIINLIMLCPTCHSKITKGDILSEEVKIKKMSAQEAGASVQFLNVTVDSENCGWVPIENVNNAFELRYKRSLFPIFNFRFINHSDRTIVMTNIKIRTKLLPIGLSGPIVALPQMLRPVIKYSLEMPESGTEKDFLLDDEIEIPSGRAVKFQLELYTKSGDSFNPNIFRYALNMQFGFNNDFYITVPKILLNTTQDYDKLRHVSLC